MGRANLHFRWDPNNAITLCYRCHLTKWHKSPLDAAEWLQEKYPSYYKKWQDNRKKLFSYKVDLYEIADNLKRSLSTLNNELDL
jgi:hypothetical protein